MSSSPGGGDGAKGQQGGAATPGGKSATLTIGHYVLGETLGIGTFGKVKGTFGPFMAMASNGMTSF